MQDWCSQHFSSFLDKDTWPANSPDLNPLDDCIWDEFAQAINWNKVTSKSSLIAELKRGVKKIRLNVVKGKLFRLDESFVSHDTKLFKRIKSSLSNRESKDKSFFKKKVLILIKVFTRYCENRKRAIYSETLDRP